MDDNTCYTIYDIYVLKLKLKFKNNYDKQIPNDDYIIHIYNVYVDYEILEVINLNNEIINYNVNFPANKDILITNNFICAQDILKYLIFFEGHDINILANYFNDGAYIYNFIDSNYIYICEHFRKLYDPTPNKAVCRKLIKYNEIFNINKNDLAKKYPSSGIIRLFNIKNDTNNLVHGIEFFHSNYQINGPIKISIDDEHPIIQGQYVDNKRCGTFWGTSYKNGEKIRFLLWNDLMDIYLFNI